MCASFYFWFVADSATYRYNIDKLTYIQQALD